MDERSKRKTPARWSEARCHPVVLADGQAWLIPRPTWWIQPVFEGGQVKRVDGVAQTSRHFGYSAASGVDDLVETLAGLEDLAAVISIVATIAGRLLREVYDLAERELDELLCIRPDDSDPTRWVRGVMAVVTFNEATIPATTEAAHG